MLRLLSTIAAVVVAIVAVLTYLDGKRNTDLGGKIVGDSLAPFMKSAPEGSREDDPLTPFLESAPEGHRFVRTDLKMEARKSCEARGGRVVPDMAKPVEDSAQGKRRPNKCTAD